MNQAKGVVDNMRSLPNINFQHLIYESPLISKPGRFANGILKYMLAMDGHLRRCA